MSLAHARESILWGGDLVFKIGGKIFAVLGLEPGKVWLSFQFTIDEFADLM